MILILLQRFCEKQESVLGYHLCRKLIEDGNNLYVTTTSTGEELESEKRCAEEITKEAGRIGCVVLLTPQGNDNPEHSRFITSLDKRHFEYLSTLDDIGTIIGLLPGTAEFAAKLNNALNSKLVLFATDCITVGQEQKAILQKSDEVWCLGPKAHIHFKRLCQGISSNCGQRCKEILLKPHVKSKYYWQGISSRKILSRYNTENKSANVMDYQALCSALRQLSVNAKKVPKTEPEWLVHGLNEQKQIVRFIQRFGKQDEPKFTALCEVSSLDEIIHMNNDIFALIVPDVEDNSFNFIALSAMWLGIPTIVSSQTAVGHFIHGLPCSSKTRSVIHLTKHQASNHQIWTDKLSNDILNEDARPMEWARKLSHYLQNNPLLWGLDIPELTHHLEKFWIMDGAAAHPRTENGKHWYNYAIGGKVIMSDYYF